MLNQILTFQFGGFYGGGAIGNVLSRWEQQGVFSFVLPFLLLFAIIFGILTTTRIFKDNRAINGIIALVVSLLALQFDFVPLFFSEIFPRLGIGLAIILIAMILLGMFAPNRTWMTYTFFAIGAIVLVVILVNVAGLFGYGSFIGGIYWPDQLWWILLIVIVGVIIAAAVPKNPAQDVSSPLMRALTGERN